MDSGRSWMCCFAVLLEAEMNLDQEAKAVAQLNSQLSLLQSSVDREAKELGKAQTHLVRTQDAQEILQLLAQAVQQKAHERIAEVVSNCLAAVFEEPYTFQITFERKRGRTEACLQFRRGTLTVDPLRASGGGAVDVAAFALRIASLVLHRPRLAQIIVLDEPMKFVSADYQAAVREMLEQLASDMGIQIIFVTHNENYSTGKIIDI